MNSPSASRFIGKVLAGEYRILAVLGEGGMGTVFLAEQDSLARKVAVKLVHPPVSEELKLRFQREGLILSRLDHPNIVRLYAFGFLSDESFYLVMEYLHGRTLSFTLQQEEKLDWHNAVSYGVACCQALSHVHANGVVHRDLKPENIMLCPDTDGKIQAKLIDLGLAKAYFEFDAQVYDLTNSGVLLGTPHFMSPEQCRGKLADARSDLYALACILYRSVYGVCPFDADTAIGILHKHVNDEPVFPELPDLAADIQGGLKKILSKGMSKDPEKRYQTADEFAAVLQDLLDGRSTQIMKLAAPASSRHGSLTKIQLFCLLFVLISSAALCALYLKLEENRTNELEAKFLNPGSGNRNKDFIKSAASFVDKAEKLKNQKPYQSRLAANKALYSLSRLKSPSIGEKVQSRQLLDKLGILYLDYGQAQEENSRIFVTLNNLRKELTEDTHDYATAKIVLAQARIGSYYKRDYKVAALYAEVLDRLNQVKEFNESKKVYDEFESRKYSYISPDLALNMKFSSIKNLQALEQSDSAEAVMLRADAMLAALPESRRKADLLNQYAHCLSSKYADRKLALFKQAAQMVLRASLVDQIDGPNFFEYRSSDTDHHTLVTHLVMDYALALLSRNELEAAKYEYEELKRYLKHWQTRNVELPKITSKNLGEQMGLDSVMLRKGPEEDRMLQFERAYKAACSRNLTDKKPRKKKKGN